MTATYGLIGGLAAFPRRLAERAAEQRGERVARGTRRGITHVVFGRMLLERNDEVKIAERIAQAWKAGRHVLSENGFLRRLELYEPASAGGFTRQAMLERSSLQASDLELLAVFDAFETDLEPFSFRDLLLARKYAGLLDEGATCLAIARAVHRLGESASLTSKVLQLGTGRAIYAREGGALSELDGQLLIPLIEPSDNADELFDEAQDQEASGKIRQAAALYSRCLTLDPRDAVAAFNHANCLRDIGEDAEAERAYLTAIKIDGSFVEALFNLAGLLSQQGRRAAARRYLEQAVLLEPDYADAVYNLAALAFEAHDPKAAERWWTLYLELDPASDWARTARRGLQVMSAHATTSPADA